VRYLLIPRPGRGGALKEVWRSSSADILTYMDVDLSSELKYFPKLVKVLEQGADVAIGSRLAKGAKVYGRTLTREIMSRGYNVLIKLFFWTSFHDAQCGFKGIRREVAKELLPHIEDKGWFFDSELLILAEKAGYKVTEIPIVWRDDPRSTVKVAKTAWGDIKGLTRLFIKRPWLKIPKPK
jgi:glycosyltransferase involved in cell wall biosynthesis